MILVIDCGSLKTEYIVNLIDDFMDVESIGIMDFNNDLIDKYDGIIISGAPILVTEIDTTPYLEKLSWIKDTNKPVLGICFGHQMIGLLFGAFASKMAEDRDSQEIEIYEDSLLFSRLPDVIHMMEDHCETISIPPGFKLVASSDKCVNEAMEHREKPIYGVQFHPEVSGNHGRVLLENFTNIVAK